jgi:DNA-binding MarR family transcriptional regulator
MVSRPAITRIVNALETSGQVRRERSASDRRSWLIHATDAGRRVVEQGRERRVRRIAAELASLTREELSTLDAATRALEKLDR